MGQIYGIFSKLEDRIIYIGQTIVGFEPRFKKHIRQIKSDKRSYIHNKMKKYGTDNFYPVLLLECDVKELNDKEILFIDKYNTYKNGTNETLGGLTMSGYKHNENTKKLIGAKLKKRWETDRETMIEDLKKRPPRKQSAKELQWRKEDMTLNNPMHSDKAKKKLSDTCKAKYANGYINPGCRSWKLTLDDGTIENVIGLSTYCKSNNLHYMKTYRAFMHKRPYKNIQKIEIIGK
jgi:group I intron endonuclease|tara:strand:- start:3556 stop:4257 length:702 start_codon:yes stop_codon:yes gene_type:complete